MESKSTLCYLSEKTKGTIPPGAGYVSLCIKGATMPISCAADVLTWVCKKALLYDPWRVHQVMKALKTKWLKSSLSQMEKPYGISHSCYVDLACLDETALFRAALVLKWVGLTAAVGVNAREAIAVPRMSAREDEHPIMPQPAPLSSPTPIDPFLGASKKPVPKPIQVRTLLEQFEADLMERYANGFDFKETSRRLVEGRVGKAMTDAIAKVLQARMFERKDGVWLFSSDGHGRRGAGEDDGAGEGTSGG